MTRSRFACLRLVVLSLAGVTYADDIEAKAIRFTVRPGRGGNLEAFHHPMAIIADALKWETWPRGARVGAAPVIEGLKLDTPIEPSKTDSPGYSSTNFGGDRWGSVSMMHTSATTQPPLPDDSPALIALRKQWRDAAPQRFKDENGTALATHIAYKERQYREREKRANTEQHGSIWIQLQLAPTQRAAYEFLIYSMSNTSQTLDLVVQRLRKQVRIGGIGNVSRLSAQLDDDNPRYRLEFVRGNVHVHIIANGVYAFDTERIARQLDDLIIAEQNLTEDALARRRPQHDVKVELSKQADSRHVVTTTLGSAPKADFLVVRARINGAMAGGYRAAGLHNRVHPLPQDAKGKIEFSLVGIQKNLMTASFSHTFDLGPPTAGSAE